MKEQRRVIVVGAGASGYMAAITAARNGAKVTVLEHMNFTARKIEHTGNGRCNFTNREQNISCYNGGNIKSIENILKQFAFEDTVEFFKGIGLESRERDGYFYPFSNQAAAVSSVLKMEAEHLKIKVACNINISKIEKDNEIFKVYTGGYTYEGDALIIAAGSCATPSTGSDGSGYKLAEAFGHKVDGVYPALVPLKCSGKFINTLAGLRTYGSVSIVIDGEKKAWEEGELQFIKSGISGIPVFQVSRYASIALNKNKSEVIAVMDFLPMYNDGQLLKFFESRLENNYYKNLSGFLTGLLHEKVISVVSAKTGIKGNIIAGEFTDSQWIDISCAIKHLEFRIQSAGSFAQAQVCCGGVSLEELNDRLESKFVKNLFFAGEILDVDGKCGGYNLQWAWSSGYAAGKYAAMDGVCMEREYDKNTTTKARD